MENVESWGEALNRGGFFLASVDQVHMVGVPNPDQEDPVTAPQIHSLGAFSLDLHSYKKPHLRITGMEVILCLFKER